ncbi:MAG: hypothetical protein ACXWKC_11710 [Xanthobacteraceae bacterium]
MSILKLLGKYTFDVKTTMILASAFDAAWLSLQQSGGALVSDNQSSGTRELLAKRIIEIAEHGERDRQRIVNDALAQFAV